MALRSTTWAHAPSALGPRAFRDSTPSSFFRHELLIFGVVYGVSDGYAEVLPSPLGDQTRLPSGAHWPVKCWVVIACGAGFLYHTLKPRCATVQADSSPSTIFTKLTLALFGAPFRSE